RTWTTAKGTTTAAPPTTRTRRARPSRPGRSGFPAAILRPLSPDAASGGDLPRALATRRQGPAVTPAPAKIAAGKPLLHLGDASSRGRSAFPGAILRLAARKIAAGKPLLHVGDASSRGRSAFPGAI